jgi:hypothetical protein
VLERPRAPPHDAARLARQNLRREVAVTHCLAVPEIIAATDNYATLPRLVCRHLVRYRNDPAHTCYAR